MKRVVLLKADGTRQDLTPEKKPTLEQMQKWVGGYIETIHRDAFGHGFRFEGGPAVLVVNEEGRSKRLPVNESASLAFGFRVFGDVFVLQGWRL